MVSGIRLPYYATDIPCALPTEAEIDGAPDISLAYGGRRVVEVGDHFVVKFGEGVNLIEGENMLFVRERTGVRVPRVYALYSSSATSKNYIIMERIAGQTLLLLWPQLNTSEKDTVTSTLRAYFDELRQLPTPGYYGSLGNRSSLDEIFWTIKPEPAINGPFDSEDAVNEAMALKYVYDGRPSFRADFYRQCFPHVLHGNKPTFTHGDFQRKNIMIERDEAGHDLNAPNLQITILDWEKSGWYPAYWEYCMAVCALRYDDDWCLWLQKVLDHYVSQSAWLQTLRLELWS